MHFIRIQSKTFKLEEICKNCKFQNQTHTHTHKLLNFKLIQLELNYKGLMQARTEGGEGGGGQCGKVVQLSEKPLVEKVCSVKRGL